MPLGWALYLPEEWCEDPERRRAAKVPAEVEFQTKPELGVELIEQAAGWDVPRAPVLGDEAYGDNTELRERLHDAELEYVLSVGAETKVTGPVSAPAAMLREPRMADFESITLVVPTTDGSRTGWDAPHLRRTLGEQDLRRRGGAPWAKLSVGCR